MSTSLIKAAVFISGVRKFRDVNVYISDTTVTVNNGVTGDLMAEFQILETVKDGMAYDVTQQGSTEPVRLVTQLGCGCGGQKPYEVDPGYSGRLKF